MKRLIVPWVPWLCYLLVSALDSDCSQDLALGADTDQDVSVALALAAAARQAPRPPQAPDLPDDPFVEPVKLDVVAPPDMPGCTWTQIPGYPAEWYLSRSSDRLGKWDGEFKRWRDCDPEGNVYSAPTVPPWKRPAQAAGSLSFREPSSQVPAVVTSWTQSPAMRPQRVLYERGVMCST